MSAYAFFLVACLINLFRISKLSAFHALYVSFHGNANCRSGDLFLLHSASFDLECYT